MMIKAIITLADKFEKLALGFDMEAARPEAEAMYPDMTEEEAKNLLHLSDIFTHKDLKNHSTKFWIKIHHLTRDKDPKKYRKLQLAGVRARYILEPLAIIE